MLESNRPNTRFILCRRLSCVAGIVGVSEAWDCCEVVHLMFPLANMLGGRPGTLLSDRAMRVLVEDEVGTCNTLSLSMCKGSGELRLFPDILN